MLLNHFIYVLSQEIGRQSSDGQTHMELGDLAAAAVVSPSVAPAIDCRGVARNRSANWLGCMNVPPGLTYSQEGWVNTVTGSYFSATQGRQAKLMLGFSLIARIGSTRGDN